MCHYYTAKCEAVSHLPRSICRSLLVDLHRLSYQNNIKLKSSHSILNRHVHKCHEHTRLKWRCSLKCEPSSCISNLGCVRTSLIVLFHCKMWHIPSIASIHCICKLLRFPIPYCRFHGFHNDAQIIYASSSSGNLITDVRLSMIQCMQSYASDLQTTE